MELLQGIYCAIIKWKNEKPDKSEVIAEPTDYQKERKQSAMEEVVMKSDELRIGDVSKMLQISDQMIRHYEKKGIINPKRSKDGKYRIYSMADVFMLIDAVKYKEWGVNLGEIGSMVSGNYFEKVTEKLSEVESRLTDEIEYKSLYKTRLKQLRNKLRICKYNLGRYVVLEKEASEMFICGKSDGDRYERPMSDGQMASQIFDSRNISFFDNCVEFADGEQMWWYKIDRMYYDGLKIRDSGIKKTIPKQLCLCTFVNMGEMGEFSGTLPNEIYEYINVNEYRINGVPRGIIIGRGYDESGSFQRLMEVEIPIEI